jgi:hypothetical protein
MCKYNLNDKSEVRKWLLKNHPDKGGQIPKDDFNRVLECYNEKQYCRTGPNIKPNINKDKTRRRSEVQTRIKRGQIFSCMRKTANFGKIFNYHKFDKVVFDPKKLQNQMDITSPKMAQLLNNIKLLDENDQKNHGKRFKHFIFSDVKEGGYGAKIIASAMISAGYNNIIHARKVPKQQKLKLYVDMKSANYNNFALLSSNTIYGSTFNEKIKREILKLFNERPANINGKNVRLIIFDSGFKEGIDLFDVKYVHIFEPSMTIADLKQTVGRATRTCGQKGLEFQEGVGWPLYVYNYYLTVPNISQDSLYAKKFLAHNISKSETKKGERDEDILLFKNVEKFNDATMLYSDFDKAMTNLSKQLFDLAPALSVDYYLTNNLHNVADLNQEFMEQEFYLMGGAKNPMKNVNTKSRYYSINSINCLGKCGKKTTIDVPVSMDFMKKVYKKYGHPNKSIPKSDQREFFCRYMRDEKNNFCDQLNREWAARYTHVPEIVENKKHNKLSQIKDKMDELELEVTADGDDIDKKYPVILYKGQSQRQRQSQSLSSPKSQNKYDPPKNKMNFKKLRDYIRFTYGNKNFVWDPIVVENKCIDKPKSDSTSGNEISFNPTQKFIMNYFTPQSPYKGLLLWHSVGTGKTCTGVSTASSSFERAGYSILWVTRTTLKGDVWKNIFDQICHTIISDEVKRGLLIPEKINDRKKILSDRWLEPLSYKQFSNLLAQKNKLYDELLERNGATDILRKTLIIVDEAHKLYGGDLKGAERPDTDVMEKLIANSYKKSGRDSCKLLLMTATPFTNSPLELFSLTNLFMEDDSEKITIDKNEFKEKYMSDKNILTENGIQKIANNLAGYISYLNREKDATQFAQPIMINVPILMAHVDKNALRNSVFLNEKLKTKSYEIDRKIISLRQKLKSLKEDSKKAKEEYKKSKKSASKEELENLNENIKRLLNEINLLQIEIENLKNEKEVGKLNVDELKEELRSIKRSILQEYMLFKRCRHIEYKPKTDNSKSKKSAKLSRKIKSEGYQSKKQTKSIRHAKSI